MTRASALVSLTASTMRNSSPMNPVTWPVASRLASRYRCSRGEAILTAVTMTSNGRNTTVVMSALTWTITKSATGM